MLVVGEVGDEGLPGVHCVHEGHGRLGEEEDGHIGGEGEERVAEEAAGLGDEEGGATTVPVAYAPDERRAHKLQNGEQRLKVTEYDGVRACAWPWGRVGWPRGGGAWRAVAARTQLLGEEGEHRLGHPVGSGIYDDVEVDDEGGDEELAPARANEVLQRLRDTHGEFTGRVRRLQCDKGALWRRACAGGAPLLEATQEWAVETAPLLPPRACPAARNSMLRGTHGRTWAHRLASLFRIRRPEEGKMAARPLPKSAAPTSSPLLPSVSCPPEKEFADRWGATGTQAWYPWVPLRVQRVSRLALNAMFDRCGVICRRVAATPTHVATHSRFRRGVVALLLTGSSVLGISSVEGILALREVTSANWTFIPGYAALQMLPSIVWASTPADVVAAAMGFDADAILRDWAHGASPHTTADAARQIASAHLQATRSVIAGFMIIAQILRGVNLTVRSGALYRVRSRARTAPSPADTARLVMHMSTASPRQERVMEGREPPPADQYERVLRLCGRESAVTSLSLARYGRHILPVYEEPQLVAELIRVHSEGERVPVFWHVGPGQYGAPWAWSGLDFSESCLLHTSTGAPVRVMGRAGADHPLGTAPFPAQGADTFTWRRTRPTQRSRSCSAREAAISPSRCLLPPSPPSRWLLTGRWGIGAGRVAGVPRGRARCPQRTGPPPARRASVPGRPTPGLLHRRRRLVHAA